MTRSSSGGEGKPRKYGVGLLCMLNIIACETDRGHDREEDGQEPEQPLTLIEDPGFTENQPIDAPAWLEPLQSSRHQTDYPIQLQRHLRCGSCVRPCHRAISHTIATNTIDAPVFNHQLC